MQMNHFDRQLDFQDKRSAAAADREGGKASHRSFKVANLVGGDLANSQLGRVEKFR